MRYLLNLNLHFKILSDLSTNIAAGYLALIIIAPLVEISLSAVFKNFAFGLIFYCLAILFEGVKTE